MPKINVIWSAVLYSVLLSAITLGFAAPPEAKTTNCQAHCVSSLLRNRWSSS